MTTASALTEAILVDARQKLDIHPDLQFWLLTERTTNKAPGFLRFKLHRTWVNYDVHVYKRLFIHVQGAFGKFLAWSFISVTDLQTLSRWYYFKELSFLYVKAQIYEDIIMQTRNFIVNTCTVSILKTAKFQWEL